MIISHNSSLLIDLNSWLRCLDKRLNQKTNITQKTTTSNILAIYVSSLVKLGKYVSLNKSYNEKRTTIPRMMGRALIKEILLSSDNACAAYFWAASTSLGMSAIFLQ